MVNKFIVFGGGKGVKGSYRLFEPKEIKADSFDWCFHKDIWLLTPNGAKRSDNSFNSFISQKLKRHLALTPLSPKKVVSSSQRTKGDKKTPATTSL